MIRKTLVFIILLFCTSFNVFAEETDIYKEQYFSSNANNLSENLPEESKNFMEENGLSPENKDWIQNVTPQNVFTHIGKILKEGAKEPLLISLSLIAIILISSALGSNADFSSSVMASDYATVISAAALLCVPVFSAVTASVNAMKGSAVFMTSFIPIFAAIVVSSGAPLTAVSSSSILLLVTQVVNYICNFVIMPLMSGFLSVSIASNISPVISKTGVASGIKKIAFWIMSLVTTVFVGILSIQTAVNSAADNLSVKTAKFIIGSAVPVAGTALSESLTTVTASMSLLKSSIGIYGVIACAVMFLPLILELFLWRIGLIVSASIGDLFSVSKISSLLRSIDSMMSLLIGIILLTLAMFVISLAVIVMVGKT